MKFIGSSQGMLPMPADFVHMHVTGCCVRSQALAALHTHIGQPPYTRGSTLSLLFSLLPHTIAILGIRMVTALAQELELGSTAGEHTRGPASYQLEDAMFEALNLTMSMSLRYSDLVWIGLSSCEEHAGCWDSTACRTRC